MMIMKERFYPEANLTSLEVVQNRPTHYLFVGNFFK